MRRILSITQLTRGYASMSSCFGSLRHLTSTNYRLHFIVKQLCGICRWHYLLYFFMSRLLKIWQHNLLAIEPVASLHQDVIFFIYDI